MSREVFEFKSLIPASSTEVFEWHKRNGAFDRLSPPWVDMQILERSPTIQAGARVVLLLTNGPLKIKWTLEHDEYVEGVKFADRQLEGPFASWHHVHSVEKVTDDSCYLNERVEYELPAGELGELAGGGIVHRELERLFQYRHKLLIKDFESKLSAKAPPLKVLVSGSTGLIGTALVAFLTTQGHEVTRLVRQGSQISNFDQNNKVVWDPYAPSLNAIELEGLDAIVHLSGDNLSSERWTATKKRKILQSRLKTTQLLCQRINQLQNPPQVLISGSAIGIYGDRGAEPVTESSTIGTGFLADVCEQWEEAARAVTKETRLVNLRTGVVLTPKGGALQKMYLPFKMGAGGPIGSGHQYFSWVDIDDVLGAILHCIVDAELNGPVNMVSPNPVTNAEFAKTLGHVLERPAFMPMPAVAVRTMFGEMADECLLAGQKVLPEKLNQSGYKFREPNLEGSLRRVLGKV